MRRICLYSLFAAAWCAGSVSTLSAQGFDPSRFFDYMDSNRNGWLDRDEIERSRFPLGDRLREMRIDYSRGISRDDFTRVMERARQEREANGGSDRGRDYRRDDDRDRSRDDSRRDDRDSREDRRSGDSDRRSDSRSGPRPPPPKPRITIDLQETYRSGDANQDGQITLSEWREWKGRAAIAEFARLDLNGDGFLTPREIERGSATSTVAASPAASPSTASQTAVISPATSTGRNPTPTAAPASNGSPAGSPVAAAPAATVPAGPPLETIVIDENDSNVRRYRSQFRELDRDRNGSISAEEWERSTRIRGRFTEARIDIAQPMDSDTFVRQLLRLDMAASK